MVTRAGGLEDGVSSGGPMKGRVLVAEDSPTQAEQLKHLLEEAGYAVVVAGNGADALALALKNPPVVIISDVVMPGVDGYALCKQVKSTKSLRDCPVLLLTALSSPHDVIKALECGADSVIRKPYDEQYLLSRLRYLQANRELGKHEKTQLGVEIELEGQRHFIGAERRQILDLLISTYEEAVRLNEDLTARQRELEHTSDFLQGLYRFAEALNGTTSEQEVAETAVESALALPGVQAGWMSLRDLDGRFRLAAARGLPPGLAAPDAMDGDCRCRRLLVSGELGHATQILTCERLEKAGARAGGLRHHASIPLWIGARRLGILNLAGARPGLFREADLQILHGVGHQVAIALERARLLEHLDEEVRARTTALAAEVAERERGEETRQQLIAVLEATPDLVAIARPDGRAIYCNRAGRKMLGIGETEDLTGVGIADAHPERVAQRILREAIPAAIRDGTWSGETTLRSRDGREIPVSQVIIAHKASDGTVKYLSTVGRDISDRKRAEEALRESEAQYRGLAEGSIQGIYIHRDFVIQLANPALARMYGYERPEDLVGRSLETLIAPPDLPRLRAYAAARLRGESVPVRYEFQSVRKDGGLIWVETLVSVISWNGAPAFLATQVDVTDRRRAEEALRQSEKLAIMGELLAGVAHELNNPLSVVLGRTALLRRVASGGPTEAHAEKIGRAAEQCARIVRSFLTLARQSPPERQEVAFAQVVKEAVELLGYQLRVDGIDVTLDLAEDLPVLWADASQLHQVIVNLVVNAHHAMRSAAPPRRLALVARADPARQHVRLEARDTGPGIPLEIQARIFEPFFTTKPPGQGTGLGLSLCRGIVESHGGSIRVESQPGQGASFAIELPVGSGPVVRSTPSPAGTTSGLPQQTILVIDDDPEVASVVADMLAADGHDVEIATGGALALRMLGERAYDMIFTDVRMPDVDGPVLYREIERRYPDLARRILFLTGDTLSPETREFLERSGAPSICKPFSVEDLRRAVGRMVGAGESPR